MKPLIGPVFHTSVLNPLLKSSCQWLLLYGFQRFIVSFYLNQFLPTNISTKPPTMTSISVFQSGHSCTMSLSDRLEKGQLPTQVSLPGGRLGSLFSVRVLVQVAFPLLLWKGRAEQHWGKEFEWRSTCS